MRLSFNMQRKIIKFLCFSIIIPVTLTVSVGPRDTSARRYFDLSYPFDKDTIYFPGQRQYELHKDYANVPRNGYM